MFDTVRSFNDPNNYLGVNFFHPGKGVVKLKWMSVFLLCISLFISCSSVPYVILPEYQDVKIKNKELLIVDIDSSSFLLEPLTIGYKKSKKAYLTNFCKNLENEIAAFSTFSKIWSDSLREPEILHPEKVTIPNGDSILILLPETENIITDKNGRIADYLLIISRLELISNWVEKDFGPYGSGHMQAVYYAFWDNHKNRAVCYGKSVINSSGLNLRDIRTYRYFIGKNTRLIIDNSPFKR